MKITFYHIEKWILGIVFMILICIACTEKAGSSDPLFTKLESDHTKMDFNNTLSYDSKFNIYTYRNFYNGGGVAIGDVNNDSLPDVFFTANMLPNKLYLNKGDLVFEDVTVKSGIQKKGKWSTGVSMADVNGDGWLDIYVCNSGDIKGDNKSNELYINKGADQNGNVTFIEMAAAYGLDDKGFSTHAAFFDYDHDGDLDLYLLNNSFKAIGSFNLQNNERNIRDSLGGDKLFRNDNNHFVDVSEKAGIYGSNIGFGLGVTVGDADNDGWQDIYVSNDFFERDYLYINQRNGTFKEELETQMMSISNASMGADMADINNDAYPEIFVTDMLPQEEGRIKVNTTFEDWEKYQLDLKYDYYHQFTRNMLHLNNGDHSFSEVGRYAGISATDWSWGALITDLDNDGLKDIFVANGIYQDLTSQDYIQYIYNESVIKDVISGKADFKKLIDLIPSHPVSNYAFHNKGELRFEDKAREWGLGEASFSNGSAYGDLDNDGDLDLVVNNVNMPCFVYRNESVQRHPENGFLRVRLQGVGGNRFGIGSKVKVHSGEKLFYQEQMPMRGFESTVDSRLVFGLGSVQKIDSVEVLWPGGQRSVLRDVLPNRELVFAQVTAEQGMGVAQAGASRGAASTGVAGASTNGASSGTATFPLLFKETQRGGLDFIHQENAYVDFDRDRLIFHMLSHDGPRMAKGDVNADGLEDLYVCGARDQAGVLYLQRTGGRYEKSNEPLLEADKLSEDTDALFVDVDGDGDQDLYVCSGGSEYSPNSTALIDRLYLNDGKGRLHKSPQILPSFIFESTSCVRAGDYDKDGDQDLFVGVRLKPFNYGAACKGYILQNDGKGNFQDVSAQVSGKLQSLGMVTDGGWLDYDHDGWLDLVVTGEYMPIRVFHNEKGRLEEQTEELGLGKSNGWWNRILLRDVNGDGYVDMIAGNHGLNSRFRATETKPVQMYVGDFDGNGNVEQIVTCYNGPKPYPMALRHDLVSVLPFLKKKYLKYSDYKEQTVEDIFGVEQVKGMQRLDCYRMESSVLLNKGGKSFEMKALPWQAQLSPVYGIESGDWDGDGKEDLVLGGNFYQSKPEVGIYDASYGLMLKGDGKGGYTVVPSTQSGIQVRGAVRDIITLHQGKQKKLVFAINDGPLNMYSK